MDMETCSANIKISLNNIKGKITIIMSSHKTNVLRNCDEIYSLTKGKLEKVK